MFAYCFLCKFTNYGQCVHTGDVLFSRPISVPSLDANAPIVSCHTPLYVTISLFYNTRAIQSSSRRLCVYFSFFLSFGNDTRSSRIMYTPAGRWHRSLFIFHYARVRVITITITIIILILIPKSSTLIRLTRIERN